MEGGSLRVLVACEFSGIVRDAFKERGHDAWSCDYRSTEIPGNHYEQSVLSHEIVGAEWDLMIAHPDCTFLAGSGARWMNLEWRQEAQLSALFFVKALWKFPIKKIAIENPIGKLSSLWGKPTQIIEPYHFGDPYKKSTCLWLKNLPPLQRTNDLGGGEQACWKESPSPDRAKIRSRTYQGIAKAMAEQWSEDLTLLKEEK
jgi:hypothetical protein